MRTVLLYLLFWAKEAEEEEENYLPVVEGVELYTGDEEEILVSMIMHTVHNKLRQSLLSELEFSVTIMKAGEEPASAGMEAFVDTVMVDRSTKGMTGIRMITDHGIYRLPKYLKYLK